MFTWDTLTLHDRHLDCCVCIFEHWELIALFENWRSGACARESTSISAIPPILASLTLSLIDNKLWLLGKMGRLVTQSLTLRVMRPLFQIASSCFGSLSVHCGCHTETRYKAPYQMTETHILKDKTVNLAYRMYFECPVVLKYNF